MRRKLEELMDEEGEELDMGKEENEGKGEQDN